jgi:hypothetical protein
LEKLKLNVDFLRKKIQKNDKIIEEMNAKIWRAKNDRKFDVDKVLFFFPIFKRVFLKQPIFRHR